MQLKRSPFNKQDQVFIALGHLDFSDVIFLDHNLLALLSSDDRLQELVDEARRPEMIVNISSASKVLLENRTCRDHCRQYLKRR